MSDAPRLVYSGHSDISLETEIAALAAIYRLCLERGSSTVNRGQAARSASNSHRGFLPRHLGSSAGGTGYLNSSSVDQR
jgi:hypothetical protein